MTLTHLLVTIRVAVLVLQLGGHSLVLLLAFVELLMQLYSGGWDLLHLGLQLEGSAL